MSSVEIQNSMYDRLMLVMNNIETEGFQSPLDVDTLKYVDTKSLCINGWLNWIELQALRKEFRFVILAGDRLEVSDE